MALKIGNNAVANAFVGSSQVRRAYKGGTLVYQGFSPASEQEFIEQTAAGGPAQLLKVYGKSVVNNQQTRTPYSGTLQGLTFSLSNNVLEINGTCEANWTTGNALRFGETQPSGIIAFIKVKYISGTMTPAAGNAPCMSTGYDSGVSLAGGAAIFSYNYATWGLGVMGANGTTFTNYKVEVIFVNLTKMFGAGSEPTSVDEALRLLGGDAFDPTYDPGSLQSNKTAELRAERIPVINVWDEEWEVGGINNATGAAETSSTSIRSKHYIPVTPGTIIYFKAPADTCVLCAYRDDFSHYGTYSGPDTWVTSGGAQWVAGNSITIPAGVSYLRFKGGTPYGTTYNHDICINLSDPAINGQYFPHWRGSLSLNLSTLTSGGVVVYPDGMAGLNGHYDEAYNRVAIRRLALKVFDGTETWGGTSLQVDGYFTTAQRYDLLGMKLFADVDAISNKFPYGYAASACFWYGGTGNLYFYVRVPNSIATDIASLQTWLADQYAAGTPFEVEYVLNTEEPLLLDTPLPTDLTCVQGDILQRVSDNNCPFVGEMKFGL